MVSVKLVREEGGKGADMFLLWTVMAKMNKAGIAEMLGIEVKIPFIVID